MNNFISISSLFIILNASAQAGTAINCNEVDNMESDMIEVCAEQTNKHLNENFEALKELHKEVPKKLELLKEMQLGWIKMRDAQCEFATQNTGSNAALAGVTCEVKLTQQRANELEEMTQ